MEGEIERLIEEKIVGFYLWKSVLLGVSAS